MCLGTAYTQQNLERPLLGWSFTVAEVKYLFLHVNSKAASKCQVSYSICYCCCNKCWVSTTKFLTDLLLSTLPSKSFPPQWWEWLSNAVYSFMRFLFFQTAVCSRHCHLLSRSPNTISPRHSFHCPAAVIPFFWLWFLKPFSVPHSRLSILQHHHPAPWLCPVSPLLPLPPASFLWSLSPQASSSTSPASQEARLTSYTLEFPLVKGSTRNPMLRAPLLPGSLHLGTPGRRRWRQSGPRCRRPRRRRWVIIPCGPPGLQESLRKASAVATAVVLQGNSSRSSSAGWKRSCAQPPPARPPARRLPPWVHASRARHELGRKEIICLAAPGPWHQGKWRWGNSLKRAKIVRGVGLDLVFKPFSREM